MLFAAFYQIVLQNIGYHVCSLLIYFPRNSARSRAAWVSLMYLGQADTKSSCRTVTKR